MIKEAEILQLNALAVSTKIIGENTQYTANIYNILGSHYRSQKKYLVIKVFNCFYYKNVQ